MILFFQLNLVLSFFAAAALLLKVSRHWRKPLFKWVGAALAGFVIWSLWVLCTMFFEPFEAKVFFTKIRQLTNPFVVPLWACLVFSIMDPIFFERRKKGLLILAVLPVLASVCTVLSISGVPLAEQMMAHAFETMPGTSGLLQYKIGPLLRVVLAYNVVVTLSLLGLCLAGLVMRDLLRRRYAMIFLSTTLIYMTLETSAHISQNILYVQVMAGATWVVTAGWYYGITRFGFFDFEPVRAKPAPRLSQNSLDEC